mgnify:CR=1 FL=1
MELELRSVEVQGPTRQEGAPKGVGRVPIFMARVWAPSVDSFASTFY